MSAQQTDSVNTRAGMSLHDLEARLWSAANALRGPVDPADFKTYVFPMLFWKWISDNWTWEHARAVAEYGDDLNDEIERDFHRFTVPTHTHWADVTTKTDNIGVRIGKALAQIEQGNSKTLGGIFGDAIWGNKQRLPETARVNLLNTFSSATLDSRGLRAPESDHRCDVVDTLHRGLNGRARGVRG